MTELTVASENGKPNSPPAAAQPASEFRRDATIVSEWSTAGCFRCDRQDTAECCPTRWL